MAPKHPDPKEAPPAASSSEEEDTTSGTSVEEEETSDDPQTPPAQKIPPAEKMEISSPSSVKPAASEPDESDSGESGSETDSDSPVLNAKPISIAAKAVETNSKSKQSPAKASAAKLASKSAGKSAPKRPAEPKSSQKEAKKAKKDSDNGDDEGKKTGDDGKKQQVLWSGEAEIALLKGMIEYNSSKTGADATTDMDGFYEFIQDSLDSDFTRAKVIDKIRRLKKKYVNDVKNGKKDDFAKPHEQEAYKLAKKIWVDEGKAVKAETPVKSNATPAKSSAKPKKNSALVTPKAENHSSADYSDESEEESEPELDIVVDKKYGVANMEEVVLSRGLSMIEGEKKAALEERWRKLRIAELELFLERNKLVGDQAKLVLEQYKSA